MLMLLLMLALFGVVVEAQLRLCRRPMPFEDYMNWVENRCGPRCEWCSAMDCFDKEERRAGEGPYRS